MTEELPALHVASGSLFVRCFQLADRIGHSVWYSQDAIEVLRSVEGDSSQEFPPSGPMQELVLETTSVGKAPALMGMGSAGKSVWSCSIEADATIEAIAFDFACKTRATEPILSTYQLLAPFHHISSDQNSMIVRHKDTELCIRCFGDARLHWNAQDSMLAIVSPVPNESTPVSLKNQRRWRYVVGPSSALNFASVSS